MTNTKNGESIIYFDNNNGTNGQKKLRESFPIYTSIACALLDISNMQFFPTLLMMW